MRNNNSNNNNNILRGKVFPWLMDRYPVTWRENSNSLSIKAINVTPYGPACKCFDSRHSNDYFLRDHCVQTGSGANLTLSRLVAGESFTGLSGRSVKLPIQFYLLARYRIITSMSCIRLSDMVLKHRETFSFNNNNNNASPRKLEFRTLSP
jgi:hypothetical protein